MGSTTFNHTEVLGLYTETSLHCGAESGTGYVDQPIQRERHTQYPVIQGSTLKGVFRDEAWPALKGAEREKKVAAVFGSNSNDSQLPGTVSFGDGILAAFPVRSSGAPFHWVTCPFALERVFRLLGAPTVIPRLRDHEAWGMNRIGDGRVLLEEIRVTVQEQPELFGGKGHASDLLWLLPANDRGFAYTRSIFLSRLLVVTDDDFKELVETGTEVVTRIKLNGLGTTKRLKKEDHPDLSAEDLEGNLFVEELIPPETLFVCPLRAATDTSHIPLPPVVRLGGDETIGRGLTHVTRVPARNAGKR